MKRIAMYINQFFSGIGGEDKVGYEPSVGEGPVGPGNVILSCLKDAEITHAIIRGDNFVTGHRDEAIERIDQFLGGIELDLFLVEPAFQSGCYGMSCGEIRKYITEKYHVTAITSVNEENPGVIAYIETPGAYIMRGSKNAVRMRQDAPAMAGLAVKVLSGEEIPWAEAEGCLPRGVRVSIKSEEAPADRAVRMMLSKLQDQPSKTESPTEQENTIVPIVPVDAGKAEIAVITTGNPVLVGNPDRISSGSVSVWKRYDIRGLEASKRNEFYSVHGGPSTNNINEDSGVLIPPTALKEAEREGKIGGLDDYYYMTTGNLVILKEARKVGRKTVEQLKMDGIQAAILVATRGNCTRCGATMVNEMERSGIPIALITSVTAVARSIGSPRAIPGIVINNPYSDIDLPVEEQLKMRRNYIDRALKAVSAKVPGQEFF